MRFSSAILLISLLVTSSLQLLSQDLQVIALDFPAQQINYSKSSCKITIKNNDNVDFPNFSVTSVYLSTDQQFSSNDKNFGSVGYWGMKANEIKVLDIYDDQYGIDVTPGEYYLIARADYRNEVDETNENNNIFIAPITILPAEVDYRFANIFKNKTQVAKGDIVNFTFNLNNLKKDHISRMWTSFYLSKDEVFDETDLLWEKTYNGIAWRQSSGYTHSLRMPLDATETQYYVFVKMEDFGQGITTQPLASFGLISILDPVRDLSISNFMVSPMDFKTMIYDLDITNHSNAGIQGYGLKLYFSKDMILDESDTYVIENRSHDHWAYYVGPNTTVTKNEYHFAHSYYDYLPAGEWHIIAHFNYDKSFAETNYDNNFAVSNKFVIPEYLIEVRVKDLVFTKEVTESDKVLLFDLNLENENFDRSLHYTIELKDSQGQTIESYYEYLWVSFYDHIFTEKINLNLNNPLKAGNYLLEISSLPDMPLFKKSFNVAPLFSDLQETIDYSSINLTWSDPKASGNYEVLISSDSYKKTFTTNNKEISIVKNSIEPGLYNWVVQEMIDGVNYQSYTSSFELLPISVQTKNLSLVDNINDSDNKIHFQIESTSNFEGEVAVHLKIFDESETLIQQYQNTINLSADQELYHATIELVNKLPVGNYSLSASTEYSTELTVDFIVGAAISSAETEMNIQEIYFNWVSELSNEYTDISLRIYSDNYDSTFTGIVDDKHVLPLHLFSPGEYNWQLISSGNELLYNSEHYSFVVLSKEIQTENFELIKAVNDSDKTIQFYLEFTNDFYDGEVPVTFELFNNEGTLLQKSYKTLTLSVSNQKTLPITFDLNEKLISGNYKIKVSSDYTTDISYDFTVIPSVIPVETIINHQDVTIKWLSSLDEKYTNISIRVFSDSYDYTHGEISNTIRSIDLGTIPSGNYQWYLMAEGNGEIYQSETFTFKVDMILSNENSDITNLITLYPNPTSGKVFVNLPQNEDIEIYFTDSLGKTIKLENVVLSSDTIIDLGIFRSGLYILTVKDRKTHQTYLNKKIIKN